MRLPAFSVPYEGETVASAVARFLNRTAGPTGRKLDLLGLRRTASTALLPLDLQALVDAMPLGHPWCDAPCLVLVRHTLVPLYLYFAHPLRAASTMQSLVGGLCQNPAATLGLTISATKSLARRIKFCPQCVEADVSMHGNAVSYCAHQPEFVRLCASHGTPLRVSCSNCFGDRKAARMWRTVGTCECDSPSCPPVLELGHDPVADAGWLWLSKQVRFILSTPHLPTAPLLPVIRQSLKNCGFWAHSGIDSSSVLRALESRFGRSLLGEVGVLGSSDRRLNQRWPGRLLGEQAVAGERLPDVLRALLLTALVTADVADLTDMPVAVDATKGQAVPQGYGREKILSRDLLSRESIQLALEAADGKFTVASSLLRVSPSRLAVDMRRLGIRNPLPVATTRRLGEATIAAVRSALRSGEVKSKIQSNLGVSEWSIQLIELDELKLPSMHRSASIETKRSTHRETVTAYLQRHQSAGRVDVCNACVSATDWLRRFDREWLAENLPNRKVVQPSERQPLKSWGNIDQNFARAIRDASRAELAKSTRPVRLTVALLLKAAGATVAQISSRKHLVPLTLAAAAAHAETWDSFYKRKLAWALKEYKALEVPISVNLLRRVAGLQPIRLKEQHEFIVAEAARQGIPINALCFLSPLGRPLIRRRAKSGGTP
jgi:Tn7-like transposition protein D/TniQ